jgi:hypothetical protein
MNSAVGIAIGYGLEGLVFGVREAILFSSPCLQGLLHSPPSLLSNVYRGLSSSGVRRPGHEADHRSQLVPVPRIRDSTSSIQPLF